MAKERVQVQGLGDVAPGITPTIQRAGQYSVAQLRAAPVQAPRSKLLDLAEALGTGQQLLQQYGQAAEQEAQIFEEELARKSPEEVQAMLKKTEGELDKQVRRGAMGWLTSPLNQKRKLRAVGKLASSGLINEIEARMINPNADDPEDLTDLANKVRQEYISNTPALLDSTFAQEGLNEATTPRIQALVSNYGRQRAVQAKADTSSQAMDTIYNLVNEHYDGTTVSGFKEDIVDADGTPVSITNLLKAQWDELGAFSPKEQEALLQTTLTALSRDGNEVKADAFLDWASANLKIGNAKMSIVLKSRLSAFIDDSAKRFEQAKNKQTNDLVISQLGDYKAAHNAIQAGRVGVYNGKEYTDTTQLQLAAENKANYPAELELDKQGFTQLTDEINNFVRADVDPVERMKGELKADTAGLREIAGTFLRSQLQPHLEQYEKLQGDGEAFQLLINTDVALKQAIDAEASRLALSGLPIEEQKQNLLQFAQQESNRMFNEFKGGLSDRATEFDKEEKDKQLIEQTLTDSTTNATEAPSVGMFDKLRGLIGFDEKTTNITETRTALSVLGNKAAPVEEKEKSIDFIKSYGVKTSTLLAQRLKPNAWKVEPTKDTAVTAGGVSMVAKGRPGVRYNQEELEGFRQEWVKINSFLETFTSEQVLETGVASFQDTTVRFDPKLFAARTRIARILTVSEMEEAKDIKTGADMPDSIKRKARLIGVDDLVQFVKDQREFAQRLRLIK